MASLSLSHRQLRTTAPSRTRTVQTNALFGRKPAAVAEPDVEERAPAKRKENLFSQTISTLEGAVPRSKRDAYLLYEAKYGERENGRMTREQYGALRRKVGGTAKDYFKEWVEEERVENTYYKPSDAGGSVPYLPVLIGIVFAVLATTVVVVQQTSV